MQLKNYACGTWVAGSEQAELIEASTGEIVTSASLRTQRGTGICQSIQIR